MTVCNRDKIYNASSDWSKSVFNKRIQKIPIDGGFSCPNRDGKLSDKGCLYCNNTTFTPFYTSPIHSITQQIEEGKTFFGKRYGCNDFFAYFQTFSSTYAPIEILKEKYTEAMNCSSIRGLIISTRPDCINNEILELLRELRQKTYIRLEIGIEALNDFTLKAVNRCHNTATALNAIDCITKANIDCSAHLIFGLPEEPNNASTQYAKILSSTGIKFVKLHHLQIVKNSRLAELYTNKSINIKLHTYDSYVATVADFLCHLRPDIYIERFINRVPTNMLIAPRFGNINENDFVTRLCDKMKSNNQYQGVFFNV